ncbi:MAG: thiamine diphosphokinase [Syntrophomonas sp.]|nr:thiamine diphosphokinase [Syntrophomonas sp.]
MKCVIMANGEYGRIDLYHHLFSTADLVVCADGGANYAFAMGVVPSMIIGDLDSIRTEVREYFSAKQVEMRKYPQRKDYTDTQLALSIADRLGANEIVLLGTLGKRLDHTLANLFSSLELARQGIKIMHYSPECVVYLVTENIIFEGCQGDLVSVLALSEEAQGVYEKGFEYQVEDIVMNLENPYGISNVLTGKFGEVSIRDGVLAVFHYPQEAAGQFPE